MGEEALRVTSSTVVDDTDVIAADSSILQLPLVRRDQVKMDFWSEVAVSWRALVQKQHWIANVNGV